MVETWKVIDGYENYEVSDLGRVRSLDRYEKIRNSIRFREGTLIKTYAIRGYYRVQLCKDGEKRKFFVHRLVAFAFPEICGEYFEGAIINHKDENPSNNAAWNLEWCTPKYNSNYGTIKERLSAIMLNGKNCKPISQYDKNGNFVRNWVSANEAERILGINAGNIASCCRGSIIRSSAGGYVWRYANS